MYKIMKEKQIWFTTTNDTQCSIHIVYYCFVCAIVFVIDNYTVISALRICPVQIFVFMCTNFVTNTIVLIIILRHLFWGNYMIIFVELYNTSNRFFDPMTIILQNLCYARLHPKSIMCFLSNLHFMLHGMAILKFRGINI